MSLHLCTGLLRSYLFHAAYTIQLPHPCLSFSSFPLAELMHSISQTHPQEMPHLPGVTNIITFVLVQCPPPLRLMLLSTIAQPSQSPRHPFKCEYKLSSATTISTLGGHKKLFPKHKGRTIRSSTSTSPQPPKVF